MGNQRFSITPAHAVKDKLLPDTVFRTLAVLGIYGDENGWCWPGLQTIADIRGISKQAISKHIERLVSDGYLNVHRRYDKDNGAQKSNLYQIKFDYPPSTSEVDPPSTPEIDPPSTSEVDLTTHKNDTSNDPKKKLTEQQEMFEALALITGTDYAVKVNAGILSKVAAQLRKASYTAEFVQHDFMDWWLRHDWRGRKGQKPNPWDVAKNIGRVPRPETDAKERRQRFRGSDDIDITKLARR